MREVTLGLVSLTGPMLEREGREIVKGMTWGFTRRGKILHRVSERALGRAIFGEKKNKNK